MPRQNTSPANYPLAVLQQIEQLAKNIVIARKRRGETQGQWAKKLGVSQPTMARIERGDPAVAMASYVMCLWLINQAEGLADVIAPVRDLAALERELTRVRAGGARSPAPQSRPSAQRESGGSHKPAVQPADADAVALHAASPAASYAGGAYQKGLNSTAVGLAALLGPPLPSLK